MRRKIIIIMLVVITLAIALWQSWDIIRFAIIRATVRLPLPGWLQAFIWGW